MPITAMIRTSLVLTVRQPDSCQEPVKQEIEKWTRSFSFSECVFMIVGKGVKIR